MCCTLYSYCRSISNNKLSGEFPDLSSFPELQKLDLSFNQLNGSLPPSIWSIANLNVLDLSENNFSNNLPIIDESIEGQCPKSLTYLYMAGNSFNGSFPSQLFNCLKQIQVMWVWKQTSSIFSSTIFIHQLSPMFFSLTNFELFSPQNWGNFGIFFS
jgi:hypothetical protein